MVRQRDLSDPALTLAFPIGFCAVHPPEFFPQNLGCLEIVETTEAVRGFEALPRFPSQVQLLTGRGFGVCPFPVLSLLICEKKAILHSLHRAL